VADTIRGTDGADFLTGTTSDDVLVGGEGDDRLRGMGGDDLLQGGAGRDVLEGGIGSDILEGNEGDDDLEGGPGQDYLFGDEGDDALRGGDGPDVIEGGPGTDEISGGPGDDTADGGEGDDLLRGGDGADLLDGGDGDDVLFGDAGADDLSGGDGEEVIEGGDDDDVIMGGDGADDLAGGAGNDALLGGDGADVIRGGPGDDDVGGGDGPDVLFGDAGDDLLNGSGGADQLFGGPGDDTLLDDLGDDYLDGGPGGDRLQSGSGEDRLDGGPGNDQLDPGLNTDHVRGGPGDDVVILVAGDVDEGRIEVIEGGSGADTLLLDGFGPQYISEMTERPHAASDSTPGPEFTFTVTDPSTSGLYQVSQMEVVRYVTRLPVAEWGGETRAVILNPSPSTVAELELDFVGGDGQSLLHEPGDSVAEWAALSVAPQGVVEFTGETFGISGAAVVRIRSNTPVSAVVVGELADLGRLGYGNVSRQHRASGLLDFDREAGTSMTLVLATDGVDRKIQVMLVPATGGEIDSEEVEVPGGGSTLIDIGELFPSLTKFEGSVRVVGGPVHGLTIQTGPGGLAATSFPLGDGARRGPPNGPPQTPREDVAPLYFPGAVSPDRGAVLTLFHYAPPATEGSVELRGDDGEPVTIRLAGGESEDELQFALANGARSVFEIDAAPQPSSLRIQSESGMVGAVLLQDYGSSGAVRRGPAVVGDDLIVPVAGPDLGADVRIDIQSLDENSAVRLTLRDAEGEEVGSGQVTLQIPALGTAGGNLAELFPEVDTDGFMGSLGITSSSLVAVSVVHLLPAEGSGFELPVEVIMRRNSPFAPPRRGSATRQ